jgi:hypothetical protein
MASTWFRRRNGNYWIDALSLTRCFVEHFLQFHVTVNALKYFSMCVGIGYEDQFPHMLPKYYVREKV